MSHARHPDAEWGDIATESNIASRLTLIKFRPQLPAVLLSMKMNSKAQLTLLNYEIYPLYPRNENLKEMYSLISF